MTPSPFANLTGSHPMDRKERIHHANQLIDQGFNAFRAGAPGEALIFYEEAFAIKVEIQGFEHMEIAQLVEQLGSELQKGHWVEEGTNIIRGSARGNSDQQRVAAQLADRLGNWFFSQDLLDEARIYYELSISIYGQASDLSGSETTYVLQKLAGLLFNLGDLKAAQGTLDHLVRLDRQLLGPQHIKVAADLSSLARVLQDLGDLPAAKAAYVEALTIDEATLNLDNPRIVSILNGLADVLRGLGEWTEARSCLERVLAVDEQQFSPDHPKVAADLTRYIEILHGQGDREAALKAQERLLQIDEKINGELHPKFIADLEALSDTFRGLGLLTQARQELERALGLGEKVFGPQHIKVAVLSQHLGSLLQEMGELALARDYYRRAVDIFKVYLPAHDPNVMASEKALDTIENQLRMV